MCAGGAVNIIGEAGAHTTHFIVDKCIDQVVVMVLNGDIVEYENIGGLALNEGDLPSDVDVIVAIANVINWFVPIRLLRLSGGAGELALRQINTPMDIVVHSDIANYGRQLAEDGLNWLGERAYNNTVAYFKGQKRPRQERREEPPNKKPSPPLRGGGPGAAMLAWKNSLTKMYHTYQTYNMSPALLSLAIGSKYVHRLDTGNGPHLYWIYNTAYGNGTEGRNNQFNDLTYWDGGFGANPTEEVPYAAGPPVTAYEPKKNFRLGSSGIIYIFAADWPGTIMNKDSKTQDTTNQTMQWLNFAYQGTVTTTNYPRLWTSVFANTNWQYLTVYGIQYRFDVTNVSARPYILEISLFKFKADIDAMDYEKQCLAHFGGYHTGTNAYCQKLPYLPNADVNIVKTNRYRIKGMNQRFSENLMMEDSTKTGANRTIRWNIKRRYVLKRPLLNSYETTLTEKDIFTKYYEAQNGLYFRFMAWPEDISFWTSVISGSSSINANDSASPNIPVVGVVTAPPTTLGSGLQINMYKKAYFKLDENTTTF